MKPNHVIDASVLFGIFDKKNKDNRKVCERYLHTVGYKYDAFITISLLGETFLAITKDDDVDFRNAAYAYVEVLIKEDKLKIIPIIKEGGNYVEKVSRIHQSIDDDDLVHLSNILSGGHTVFVTLDKKLVGEKMKMTRQRIKQECGLNIYHPNEIIKELNLWLQK